LDRAAEDRFNVVDGLEKTLVITRNLWKYGIELEKDFDEVPDIFCSPSRLNQVFINLITNAVQAMDGKGTLKLGASSREDWVEITLEDTGCGIPEENLNKIMDPFFTTKPVGKGTGLGLSIVHQIVEEHEGQLLVDSKEGVGTRFTLGFPVRRKGKGSASGESTDEAESSKTLSVIGSGSQSPAEIAEDAADGGDEGDAGADQHDSQDKDSSHTEAAA
jgi:signal transduction histidine kinase